MRILALNGGSSSLKYGLYQVQAEQTALLLSGTLRGLGPGEATAGAMSYEQALQHVADELHHEGAISAVAHRVVHGGRFTRPTIITPRVLTDLDAITNLAPLHNGPALRMVRAAAGCFGPSVPHVAVFDTAFHHTLPAHAAAYAIPFEIAERHGIRRFGFHGLAHQSMLERYAAHVDRAVTAVTAVTLQLGSGCSATAIRDGRSIDTSMGFTPLEGLMMGTRSGDLDPALVGFLAQAEGISARDVEALLNNASGLLGVSGLSADVPALLEAEAGGHVRAGHALNMFCYRAARYLASYLGLLGAATVVFGGGIGEHAPAIRARICAHLAPAGLELDAEANEATIGSDGLISSSSSRWPCHVICVDEERILTRDAALALSEEGSTTS